MRLGIAATIATLVMFFLSANQGSSQQVDFFWSDLGPNQGAINKSNLYVFAGPDETVTLYLYYSTNGSLNADLQVGALLDVVATDPNRVRFLSATVFEFDISVVDTPIETRWDHIGGTVAEDLIDEWGAFSVFGAGIRESNNGQNGPFIDEGYDPSADAFLFGRIELELTEVGPVKILTRPGDGQVVGEAFNCGQLPLQPTFTSVTIGPITPNDLGDVNQDGKIDLLDVQPFVDLLTTGGYLFEADINCDGSVNLLDVAGFVAILTDTAPPPLPLIGDLNQDGVVDLLDVVPFVQRLSNSQYQVEGDVNQDGRLDLLDVNLFSELLGGPPPPSEGDCLLGDVNGDGIADLFDVAPFSQLILDGEFQCEADLNEDGAVNLLDIPCLIKVFPGG